MIYVYVGVQEAQHTVQHIKIHFIFLSHICDLLPQIQAFPLSATKLKIELCFGVFKKLGIFLFKVQPQH